MVINMKKLMVLAWVVSLTCLNIFGENDLKKIILSPEMDALLNRHCYECHDEDVQKGEFQLDHYEDLNHGERLKFLNKIEEQIYLNQMPPKKKKPLSEKEKNSLLNWVTQSFDLFQEKSEFREKLLEPKFGNLVDHNKLFSGEIKAMAFSPSRRWLISPSIFKNKIQDIFKLGTNFGIINPFNLPDISGVRDYDNKVAGGDHFLTMLENVKIIADYQLNLNTFSQRDKLKKLEIEKKDLEEQIRMFKNRTSELFRKAVKTKSERVSRIISEIENPKKGKEIAAPFRVILNKSSAPNQAEMEAAIRYQYAIAHAREPNQVEISACLTLMDKTLAKVGKEGALKRMLMSVILQPDFIYRQELGDGPVDRYGRKLLTDQEASYAIAYALTDRGPDKSLVQAAQAGKLKTKAEYQYHIERLLSAKPRRDLVDPRVESKKIRGFWSSQPVKLKFFREFFGYPKAYQVFKDNKRLEGGTNRRYDHDSAIRIMINETDLLVEKILLKDQDVFNELLTSDKFYLYHNGDNKKAAEILSSRKALLKKMQSDFEKMTTQAFWTKYRKDLDIHFDLDSRKGKLKLEAKQKLNSLIASISVKHNPIIYPMKTSRAEIKPVRDNLLARNRSNMFNIDHNTWSYVDQQPFKIPHRMGLLTHPTWLTAHSLNVSTDPVKRGLWIREKLLAGFIPDVPITADAAIPEDHHKTLRQRLHEKTSQESCWTCHVSMNPLGYAFEMFDDLGRFRTKEELEYPEHLIKEAPNSGPYTLNSYKKVSLDTTGYLSGTGDKNLDGEVANALDLITRLAKSDRVRQSIIRHAFRYFMGRNERLSDSKTLIAADKAYLGSGGSFNAVIVSLLTSDSFMYRK